MSSNSGWDVGARHVGAAVAGDRHALAALIRATQPEIWRFFAYQVAVREADDLTQETYLRMIRALPRFEGRSSLQTWLLVIARRVVVDHIRDRDRRPRTTAEPDWSTMTDPAGGDRSAAVDLRLLVADLPTERREALVLTQILGLSYAEAAEICDVPVGTIRSRIARARNDLIEADRIAPPHRRRTAG